MREKTIHNQDEFNAAVNEGVDLIVVDTSDDIVVKKCKNLKIKRVRNLNASRAKISGNLWAGYAEISGTLWAGGAEIGGTLWAYGAKIGGTLYVGYAKIGGVKIEAPTKAEREIISKIPIDRLEMGTWHGSDWDNRASDKELECGTTHCLAGWAQVLNDNPKIRRMEPIDAGRKLLPNYSYLFFAPDDIVRRVIEEARKS